jgi:CRP-like cAMP-binding protein/predicted acylesterase/phospholipase RssA
MPIHDLAALLGTTSMFSALSRGSCRRVADLLKQQDLVPGEVLAREGDPGDALFLVLEGSLKVGMREGSPLHGFDLGRMGPGCVVGELALLTGHPRAATITANELSVVAGLSRDDFDLLCRELPEEMETVTAWMRRQLHTYQIRIALYESPLFKNLSPLARAEMESSLEWTLLRSGETLFRAGEPGEAMYLVVSGRLRLVLPRDAMEKNSPGGGSEQLLAELGKGDTLGEMALLTREPRSASAYAIRDTQLARLDRGSFDQIVAAYPQEMLQLFVGQMAERLRRQNRGRKPEGSPPVSIAVVLASPLARQFAVQLATALSVFGSTLHLNRTGAIPSGGVHRAIAPDAAEARLLSWLNEQETLYRHVVYETDEQEDGWTIRCLRQADIVFLAVDAEQDPHGMGARLRTLMQCAERKVASSLVLLHGRGAPAPSHTKTWLAATGTSAHWHLRNECVEDVGRIARSLCGRSVGLVLGGGFAFGLAHIGVTQAFRDLDVPVDYVGGTSMGAIIAMTRALDCSRDQMLEILDKGCAQSLKGDYTLPIVSLLTGKNVARSMAKFIADRDIEDLWLPYFAISTSLVHAGMVVHRSGNVLRSVLASSRAPGIFPPLGWNDEVLIDGGLINNVPCDVMRREIPTGTVIAVDVSRGTDFSVREQFDMHLSGWKVALGKANPFSQTPGPATMAGIFARLVRLGGAAHYRQIRSTADLYLEPPLQGFTFRDFKCGEEMSQIAYDYTLKEMQRWIDNHGRPWQGGEVIHDRLPT